MWWDELLVPMAARHSLAYIFDLCSVQETHPPLFYLLTKAVLFVSSGDSVVRLLSALFGTISIYILYRIVRESADESIALFAAALFSLNLLHIMLSRSLRPYALHTALFLLACWMLTRLIRNGRWTDIVLLCCANLLLFWIHYLTYYMVFAQGVVLAICLFSKSSPFTYKQFIAFCLVTVLIALPVSLGFFLPSLARQIVGAHLPRLDVLQNIGGGLRVASFFVVTESFGGGFLYLASLAGGVAFLLRKPKFAALSLLIGAIPFTIILIMAPGYPLQLWHVVWVTPLLSLCVAMLLSWLPKGKVIAPLLAAGGALYILVCQHTLFYAPPFGIHETVLTSEQDGTDLRATAARLATFFEPGALIADAASPGFFNTMSWYLDQSPSNPLAVQRLGPQNSTVTLHFLAGHTYETQQENPAPYIKWVMGDLGKVTRMPPAIIFTFQLERKPIAALASLPATFIFSANPKDFYSTVFQLSNVRTISWHYENNPLYANIPGFSLSEGGVVTTQNNKPSSIKYVITNNAGDRPMLIFLNLRYLNDGSGNEMSLFARFDDETPQLLTKSAGPDKIREARVKLSRDKPFKRLEFAIEMYCKDNTARYTGDNLRTLTFQGLDVSFVGAAAPATPPEGAAPRAPQN